MIRFKKLEINNFRSFYGKHVLDFDGQGLWVVRGNNFDTNGESAAGKSSVLLAFSYLLNINSLPAKEFESWGCDDDMQCYLDFIWDEKEVRLARGLDNYIEIDGAVTNGSKNIEEKLEFIFKVNNEQRYQALYKEQGLGSYFLNKTSSDKKEFLNILLQLKDFESKITKDEKNIDSHVHEKNELFKDIGLATSKISDLSKNQLSLALPVYDTTSLATINQEIKNMTLDIENYENNISKIRLDFDNYLHIKNVEISKLTQKISEVELYEDIFQMQAQLDEMISIPQKTDLLDTKTYQLNLGQVNDIKKEIKAINNEIVQLEHLKIEINHKLNALELSECYTCHQKWSNESEVDRLLMDLKQIDNQLDFKKNSLPQDNTEELLRDLEKRREEQKRNQTTALSNINKLKKDIHDLKNQKSLDLRTKIEKLNQEKFPRELEYTKNINELKDLRIVYNKKIQLQNKLQNEYFKHKLDLGMYEQRKLDHKNNISKEIANLDRLNIDLVKNDNTIKTLEDKAAFTKSFLNYILVDVLNEISQETNSILSRVPNVSNITISLIPEKITQKGDLRQDIQTVVKINGHPRSFKSGLSGGMQTAVQLAADLALRNILSRRVGIQWGLLLLDEQFGGLDLVCKQACMSILSEYSKDTLVLVIDHDPILNETADKILYVKHENGKSECTYL